MDDDRLGGRHSQGALADSLQNANLVASRHFEFSVQREMDCRRPGRDRREDVRSNS
jgi:hypothetical protein